MQPNSLSFEQNQHVFHLTSIAALPEASLMVSSLGDGIFRISAEGKWERTDAGLPDGTAVNRLEADGGTVYACTNKGLFLLDGTRWQPTDITFPCYRVRGKGGTHYAATQYGLWYRLKDSWMRTDYTNSVVYDLLISRQLTVLAQEKGITLFDRYALTSSQFQMDTAVSSLTVLESCLIGASGRGELVIGKKCGHFDVVRFGKIKIFSVNALGARVYACTDRGLYQILFWGGRFHLCSVKLGVPVMDVALGGEDLHLATFFEGVQTIKNLTIGRK